MQYLWAELHKCMHSTWLSGTLAGSSQLHHITRLSEETGLQLVGRAGPLVLPITSQTELGRVHACVTAPHRLMVPEESPCQSCSPYSTAGYGWGQSERGPFLQNF